MRLTLDESSASDEQLLYDITDTRKILGNVGRSTIYNLLNENKLRAVKIRNRTLITGPSIRAYYMELADG